MPATKKPRTRAKVAGVPPEADPSAPPTSMTFKVGPHIYTAVVADRSIFDFKGDELEGWALEGPRRIILSPTLHPNRRWEVLRHEVEHCWLWHCAKPVDDEDRCNFAAFVGQAFEQDLERQGGRRALERMALSNVPVLGLCRPPAMLPAAAREIVVIFRKVLELVEKEWDRLAEETHKGERDRVVSRATKEVHS